MITLLYNFLLYKFFPEGLSLEQKKHAKDTLLITYINQLDKAHAQKRRTLELFTYKDTRATTVKLELAYAFTCPAKRSY